MEFFPTVKDIICVNISSSISMAIMNSATIRRRLLCKVPDSCIIIMELYDLIGLLVHAVIFLSNIYIFF